MSDAITNKIKTQMATYIVDKTTYDNATAGSPATLSALRLSNNSVVGATEKIESDVILPNTRIKSVPETGTQSSSGSTESEWNIDEQDEILAAAMCSNWVTDSEQIEGAVTDYKTLDLGTAKKVFYMLKYFDQNPVEYKWYTGLQVNQITLDFALKSFVKLTTDWLGSNNPKGTTTTPLVNASIGDALTTKAFKTLEGYIKMGDTAFSFMTQIRQCPAFNLTINNNKEATDALFETEAIEMSDGDFEVTGNIEFWKADALGMSIFNDAVDGADKGIEINVSRNWIDSSNENHNTKTEYIIRLVAHLDTPTEDKDGNKYKVTVPYSVNVANGIKFIKKVTDLDFSE